ncbi:uncharacterized protein LOC106162034 [Lingula anatina]|uniref:Uncharacterized protein LOC106162034 n=1 Tax=Lingula anatina TaxID=7574 RepID=A0A1S3I8K6_LINAN|nr:uncharacterized protein LOC106162034 [Lingula anatina]|eukprot:XP_013394595.1 uncharacterized protein LOC106162034 [Lingula anatina]
MGCGSSIHNVPTVNGNDPRNNRKLDKGQRRQGDLDQGQRRQGELDQGQRRQGELDQGQRRQGDLNQGQRRQGDLDQGQRRQGELDQRPRRQELHQGQRPQGELDQRQRRQGEQHQGQQDQAVQVFFPSNYTGIPEVAETPHLVNILPNQEIYLSIALQVVDTGQEVTVEEDIVQSASPDDIRLSMSNDLDVAATNIQVRQGSVIIDMKVIGWESLEKLLKSSKNGQLEKCLKKVLLTPDITKGKDMSLKMHIVNEDKLRKLVKLMKLLCVKDAEKGNGQSSESVRFTFCPERRMWFWTPYHNKPIWMEVSHERVRGGPRQGHAPADKYLEIIKFLQQEKPTLKDNTSACVICDLVGPPTKISVSPPSAGTKNRTTGMEGGASGTQEVEDDQNMSVPLNRKDKLRVSRDSGYGSPRDPPDASSGDQGEND